MYNFFSLQEVTDLLPHVLKFEHVFLLNAWKVCLRFQVVACSLTLAVRAQVFVRRRAFGSLRALFCFFFCCALDVGQAFSRVYPGPANPHSKTCMISNSPEKTCFKHIDSLDRKSYLQEDM